jgi:hypothetical protein
MHNIPFGVPEPMVTRSAMAAPNGGYRAQAADQLSYPA